MSSPSADTVTRHGASLDTVPRPITIHIHGASSYCHHMPGHGASALVSSLETLSRPSAMTYIDKVLRPCACLDKVLQASACLDTVPRPSSMTCLDKVSWPSAGLDTVTRLSASLDTVPKPSSMTCLDKVP